jgi:hypothetical protein
LPDAKGGGPIHFKSISLNRYEQGLLARAVPGAMLLTPPQVDGLLRDVVTKHLNKVERLSAAAKSFPNFNASHAERDDRRAASAYRLLHAQGPSAVVRPIDETQKSVNGMTAADIAVVQDHLAMLRINDLVPTRQGRTRSGDDYKLISRTTLFAEWMRRSRSMRRRRAKSSLTDIHLAVTLGALFPVDCFRLSLIMSYVDGSDGDYGGDYPSNNDTVYDYRAFSYEKSANSLGYAMVASYGTTNYGHLDEPACSEQELKFKAPIAAAFADDSSKPYGFGDAKQLDQSIQKFQSELQADPGKFSLQCFGPPSTQPQGFLGEDT